MSEARKPLVSDNGKGHSVIKWYYIGSSIAILAAWVSYYNRWNNWRLTTTLFYERPAEPAIIWPLVFTFITAVIVIATVKAIGRSEIHVFPDSIEGYGIRFWAIVPRAQKFELKYDEITAIKLWRHGLSIRSNQGRFNVNINEPDIIYDRINEFL